MTCKTSQRLLNDYVDGTLEAGQQAELLRHVEQCPACSEFLTFLKRTQHVASGLPRSIPPPEDLWDGIAARIGEQPSSPELSRRRNGSTLDRGAIPGFRQSRARRKLAFAAGGVAAALLIGIIWQAVNFAPAWQVAVLQGPIIVNNRNVESRAMLRSGGWLETGAHSRAKVVVGEIGEVEVEPNSRLRLLSAEAADHRVELSKGTIHATIWAPPRLFFVETPAATAIDLGCVYTLSVDDSGGSLLVVTAGIVALESKGRESLVPAGAACRTTLAAGPGVPYRMSASETFRSTIAEFELHGNTAALSTLLQLARPEDAVTLWHLLQRTKGTNREQVFTTLASLTTPPPGVTREGILNNDKEMLHRWGEELGLMF